MKVEFPCPRCRSELAPEVKAMTDHPTPKLVGEVLNGGIVRAKCKASHELTVVMSDPLFDLMFELAALALVDGHYREAVLGIATSLERFYEFCIRIVAHRQRVQAEAFKEAWKHVKRAERQFGAFVLCYLLDTKRPFDAKSIEACKGLRNRTTHEGYIPTREEAMTFGNTALVEMHRILNDLFPGAKEKGLDAAPDLLPVIEALVAEQSAQLEGEPAHGSLGRITLVNARSPAAWGAKTFSQLVEEFTWHRGVIYAEERR
jgi:hypothetical protein